MDERDLGQVITVINELPIKFDVKLLVLEASTRDKIRKWPLAYKFYKIESATELSYISDFAVRVEDRVVELYFSNNESHPELHNSAILFGLISKGNEVVQNQYDLTEEKFNDLKEQENTNDKEVFGRVLNFIYRINETWPNQHISHFDIFDNFAFSKEKMSKAWQYWNRAGYLEYIGSFQYRTNRGNASTSGFYIKPQMIKQVVEKLSEYNQLEQSSELINVFLSYSSRDRKLAGLIKRELEKSKISVFLAHEDIEPSEEWIVIIQENLDKCDAFLILLTENCKESNWTDQESGQVYSMGKLIIPIKVSLVPYGFIGKIQAVTLDEKAVGPACNKIIDIIEQKFSVTQ
ncbi:MAG: toll/interleukin-1 receptor domain-containing protein [candidate division Zixibacteria bacterium]|nr:toll/interleukin-1 receptor domain-containing protein [candidate division Zixibacteria bacterium]